VGCALLLGVGILLALAPSARADGLADEAELHFQLGAERYQQGDLPGALQHFLLSNRLVRNRNVVFNVARTYERMERYADAHRYYVDAFTGEKSAERLAELEASLERIRPKVAVLSVRSDPPGATIYLDRRDLGSRGRAPRLLAVPPGRYRVIVEQSGYRSAESEPIEVAVGQQVDVRLAMERIVGTVEVRVGGASHATVRVDDERSPVACRAPCSLQLPPGKRVLYLSHPRFRAAPLPVTVRAGRTATATATMIPLRGSVVVETDEPGAKVEIDGRPMGFTPTVIQNVPVGRRRVRVSLRGFEPVEREVTVAADEQAALTGIELSPIRQVAAVSRMSEDADEAPSSLTIIDGREIRAFGYPTIAEALRGVRGVSLNDDRAYVSAGIRGIGDPNDYGNRLLVLSDGLSLNDNLLNSSYLGTDGRVDLHDIDRIEVVRGPGSLLYGTGAFSGVVNLVPRGQDHPSNVHASAGTNGHGVARGRVGGQYNFADDGGFWASAAASRSDGFDLPVELIAPGAGEPVQTASRTDAFGAAGTAGRLWYGPLNAQFHYHQREQFIPVGAVASAFNDPRTVYLDRRVAGEVRYEPSWSLVDLSTRAHVHHYRFHGFYVAEAPDPHLVEDYFGSWFGAEARARIKPLDELHVTLGGEVQIHPVASMVGDEADDQQVPLPAARYLDEERPYNFGAAYALVDVVPFDWFRGTGGVRFDFYDTFGAIVVPRGALLFKPAPGGVLKLMFGRAFRAPSVYEQYYNDGGFSQVPGQDPDRDLSLRPESIYSAEIEYLQRFAEDWVAVGSVHGSYVEDLITTVLDPIGPDVIRYANDPSPVGALGGEVELRHEWRQGWMLSGFYGYQRTRLLEPATPELRSNPRLNNAPQHWAGTRAVAPIYGDLARIGLRASLEAPRRIDLASDDVTVPAIVVDAALSGEASAYGLSYVLGIYNLFDWRYEYPVADTFASRTIVQNGRTVLLDLVYRYP
jgi:outer membrane receptor protein involved in Fe transport